MIRNFVFKKTIGTGSFATVYLAKHRDTDREYAIKVMEKQRVLKENLMKYVRRERDVLQIVSGCSYFTHLHSAFEDAHRFYFVLTYAKNGNLLTKIAELKGFSVEAARYYAAELLLALEMLHSKDVIHRDLKPENIVIDENWHIVLIDFGSAKMLAKGGEENGQHEENVGQRKSSFVGTPQYVSPEVLTDAKVTPASDLWAFGCILYQMLCGEAPFVGEHCFKIFQKILNVEYGFPQGFHKAARDLVEKLVVVVADERLGANDPTPYVSIREHPFFGNVDFKNLGPPPFKFI